MITIWKSLIQPKLDYCSQLWSPSDQASIALLESLQKTTYRGQKNGLYQDILIKPREVGERENP
mgnify:CR=1 FL=1